MLSLEDPFFGRLIASFAVNSNDFTVVNYARLCTQGYKTLGYFVRLDACNYLRLPRLFWLGAISLLIEMLNDELALG